MEIPSLPFKVLALAPFQAKLESPWRNDPLRAESTNLDEVMESLGISLYLSLPKSLCPPGGLTFSFKRIKDFHPEGLVESHPFLRNILEARKAVQEAKSKNLSGEEIYSLLKAWPDLPLEIQFAQKTKPDPSSASPVDNILQMVAFPDQGAGPGGETQSLIEQIDSRLRQVLLHIFADETFRNLESVWRGLNFLLKRGKFNGDLSLEIVPTSWATLEETLNQLLLRLVNDLPSLILIDLPLDNSPRMIELLEKIALFSETLLVPSIGWINQNFLYLDTWQDLAKLPFLPHYLEGPAYAKWRSFKKSSPARWVGLTCNRFLVRYPYGKDNSPGRVWFEESRGLWASPVWGMGSLIAQSLLQTGWPTRFTEWQNIRLEDLALKSQGEKSLATEVFLSEERMDQFVRGGIIPLVAPYDQDTAFMPAETTVAGSSLGNQLFLARITQFLFRCKDNLDKGLDPEDLEKNLRKAFSSLWERTGHSGPEKLQIAVSKPKTEKPSVVRFILEPSRQVLPSGEKIELELNW